jgi:biotin-dependent carboxylase-like uncharacterized protein
MALANRLCGNLWDAPVLEVTLGGFSCEAQMPSRFAITGGDASVRVGNTLVGQHRLFHVEAGAQIEIGFVRTGCRVMLAVAGGFVADELFGSASTYLPAAFGGFHGRAVKAGDVLQFGSCMSASDSPTTPPDLQPVIGSSHLLRITMGPEWESLTEAARTSFFATPFRAAQQIDRMGIRLEGNCLELRTGREQIRSAAVAPGTIQCPGGGLPILLGPDAQVTGGYPRIASVITADLWRMGQIKPRDQVRFFLVDEQQAAEALRSSASHSRTWCGSEWLTGAQSQRSSA